MKKMYQPAVVLLLLGAGDLQFAQAQGTAFSYQGQLQNNGSPANGNFDFKLQLYDTSTGGGLIAGPVTNAAVTVSNGFFTTLVDFGPGAFVGGSNWLHLAVQTNGGNNFISLSPRQLLTPTPYALFAASASYLSGTLPAGQLPAGVVINNGTGVELTGSFSGNGAGLANVDAATLAGLAAANVWQLGGNNVAGGQFIGSTNNQPLEMWAAGQRAFRLEPDTTGSGSPNVIGGSVGNFMNTGGVIGGFIGGGGATNYNGVSYPNHVAAYYGSIGGGYGNTIAAFANAAFIGGGDNNSVAGNSAVIGGGEYNRIKAAADHGVIAGGIYNTNGGEFGVIGGGQNDTVTTNNATVAGGYANKASGQYSAVAGGSQNNASGENSAVGGGNLNTAGGTSATVGGGTANSAGGTSATVSGGTFNSANGVYGTVGGGNFNSSTLDYATVAGGENNSAVALYGAVGGGYGNTAQADGSFVGGGGYDGTVQVGNYAGAGGAFIGGGVANINNGMDSVIGGGVANVNSGVDSVIVGGISNNISGIGSFIGGGGYDGYDYRSNSIAANAATIGGGLGNTIPAGAPYAVIGGGAGNYALAYYAAVGGGLGNVAGGAWDVIGGGLGNIASGDCATMGGGNNNLASGKNSMVPGGAGNRAKGVGSFAAGTDAYALYDGSFVWADSTGHAIDDDGPNQFVALADGGFYFFTGGLAGGAVLASGATAWTTFCDRNGKKNFKPVDTEAVLDKLAAVPIEQWNYKWEKDSDVPNIGPMAQDFIAAFYPGRNDKGITTLQFDGVELAAIQGLNRKVEKQQAELKQKETEVAELKARLEKLEQRMLKQKPN